MAMLLSASQAIPPVSAPSPTTATTVRSVSPRSRKPRASPSAQLSAVEAWEFSIQSCSGFGRTITETRLLAQ